MILSIHSIGHDTGLALFQDGNLLFAMETERITRIKHDSNIASALDWLKTYKREYWNSVTHVAFSVPASGRFTAIENYEKLCKEINRENLFVETFTKITGRRLPCVLLAHELCHAMAAFNMKECSLDALCFVNEGSGYFSRNCVIRSGKDHVSVLDVDNLPWFASGIGWTGLAVMLLGENKSPSVAGKVMGLASYGVFDESYAEQIMSIQQQLSGKYSGQELVRLSKKTLAGISKRLTTHKKSDFCKTFQDLFTEKVSASVFEYSKHYSSADLFLSGGCALNLPTNTVLKKNFGDRLAIPPTCNDSGQAIGAGCFASEFFFGKKVRIINVYGCGDKSEIDINRFSTLGKVEYFCPRRLSEMLIEGEVVGLFHGKAELGPRALGNRSIIASADRKGMKDRINSSIKDREWYRPLGGIIKYSSLPRVSEDAYESPHMLYSYMVNESSRNEATHVDNSSRLQTVTPESNSRLFEILDAYESLSGNPVLINTSLNGRGRPIVQFQDDLLDDFGESDLDAFVVGDWIVRRH